MVITKEMAETRKSIESLVLPILKNIKSVLDIGGGVENPKVANTEVSYYKDIFSGEVSYKCIDIDKQADISCDLNNVQTLPFKDKSIDLIIFSMVIEHLYNPIKICKEISRVSRKYILFGVPNMMVWDSRLMFLLGKVNGMDVLTNYTGHHHLWHDGMTKDVFNNFFKKYRVKKQTNNGFFKGGWLVPSGVRSYLANMFPTIFASHRYYLLERV